MSRTRAARDPYWATSLTNMTPAGQRLTRGLWALISRSPALVPYLWIGSGWRSGSSEHKTGRALDVVATFNTGIRARTAEPKAWAAMNRLVNEVLVPNASALGIRHLIWDRKIYRTRYRAWGPLPGRTSKSSIGDWHEDHLHIWLDSGGQGWMSRLDSIVLSGSGNTSTPKPKPGLPSTGVSNPPTGGLTMSDINTILARIDYVQAQLKAVAEGTYSRKALNARNADVATIVKAATDAQSRVLFDAFGKLGVSSVDMDALKTTVRKAVADGIDDAVARIDKKNSEV